jgi:hypothetical protein
MSQIEFPTKTVEFTLHLPLPDKTHPKYEAYQASVDAMKKHMAACSDDMFPRIQITAEHTGFHDREEAWEVALFYYRKPMNEAYLFPQDAICSYRGNTSSFINKTTESLATYAQEYRKLVFVLDTEDSYALIQGAPVTIQQEVPYWGYNS